MNSDPRAVHFIVPAAHRNCFGPTPLKAGADPRAAFGARSAQDSSLSSRRRRAGAPRDDVHGQDARLRLRQGVRLGRGVPAAVGGAHLVHRGHDARRQEPARAGPVPLHVHQVVEARPAPGREGARLRARPRLFARVPHDDARAVGHRAARAVPERQLLEARRALGPEQGPRAADARDDDEDDRPDRDARRARAPQLWADGRARHRGPRRVVPVRPDARDPRARRAHRPRAPAHAAPSRATSPSSTRRSPREHVGARARGRAQRARRDA